MSTSEPFQQPGVADRKVRVMVLAQCLSRAEFPGAAEAQQAKAGPEPKAIQAPPRQTLWPLGWRRIQQHHGNNYKLG